MNTNLQRRASEFRRDVGVALLISAAVQGAFTVAMALPGTMLATSGRFVLGMISVPVSALCGTLFFRSRHRESSGTRLVLLFFGLALMIVVAGFLLSIVTGNYDLP